jgi:transposase-like protein
MGHKRHSAQQIISNQREAGALRQKGQTVPLICLQLGMTPQTYYRWRKEYGDMWADQTKRLEDLDVAPLQMDPAGVRASSPDDPACECRSILEKMTASALIRDQLR